MIIEIINEQVKYKFDLSKVRSLVKYALSYEGLDKDNIKLSIAIVDNAKIRDYNKRYLKRDNITDVICFSYWESEHYLKEEYLGDIIVSIQKADEYSHKTNQSLWDEFYIYIIHGLLHLLGYNDDTKKHREMMNNRCEEILTSWKKKK